MNKRQIRAAKIAAQQALLDGATSAKRDLTAEEQAQFDALQREIDDLTLQIEEEEAAESKAAPDDAATREAAISAERQRAQEITDLCRDFGVDASAYIQNGSTVDQVRAAILENLKSANQPSSVRVTRDAHDSFRAQASDAILMRAGMAPKNVAEGASTLRGMSLVDMARECMTIEGESESSVRRMSPEEVFERAYYNPSAAFPAIMDETIQKAIVQEYEEVDTTFERITTEGSLKDFKESPDHEYVIGGLSAFEEVPENGEIKSDIPKTELLPSRQLHTYGKQFTMTRQAFVNDDIGFLTEIPGLYSARAKETIDEQVYEVLYKNPVIYDGVALFSTEHANIMSEGSKPTQETIQAALLKLQLQKNQFGKAITIRPKAIVVPIGYGFDLQVIFGSANVTGSANNDVNPLYNYGIDIVESPILNALAGDGACPWFIVAQPTSAKGIQVDYLNGAKTPTVRRMEVPGTLGFVWDIFMDWGVSVRDFRGIVMNPGVALETV